MLSGPTVPPSLLALLQVLRPCFTAPGVVTLVGVWPAESSLLA